MRRTKVASSTRLVEWWRSSGADARFQLLFRPHPRDGDWKERYAAALDTPGAAVQEPSYTDLETLATLLQHVDCVVANAGTILLDSLVNDRPAVCVLYDEGAPAGERHAELNVTGAHYEELARSAAFYRAESFEEVASGIERALSDPGERAPERARVAQEVVGRSTAGRPSVSWTRSPPSRERVSGRTYNRGRERPAVAYRRDRDSFD